MHTFLHSLSLVFHFIEEPLHAHKFIFADFHFERIILGNNFAIDSKFSYYLQEGGEGNLGFTATLGCYKLAKYARCPT